MVYEELRCPAAYRMARQPAGQTLQATALVHEAYLKLVGHEARRWENRKHFYFAAAEAMRQILIDRARKKQRLRRGGNLARVDLAESRIAAPADDDKLLPLDTALQELEAEDP